MTAAFSASFQSIVAMTSILEAGGSTLEARHLLVLLDLIASLPFLGVETSEVVLLTIGTFLVVKEEE